jgi:hypothetical protein
MGKRCTKVVKGDKCKQRQWMENVMVRENLRDIDRWEDNIKTNIKETVYK